MANTTVDLSEEYREAVQDALDEATNSIDGISVTASRSELIGAVLEDEFTENQLAEAVVDQFESKLADLG